MISDFENTNFKGTDDIEQAVDRFTKIVETAAKKSLQLIIEKKKIRTTSSLANLV